MKKILFICQANVGRSQMAEGFYNSITKSNKAISAGVEDFRKKYHFRPTQEIIQTMEAVGIDISNQEVKVLTQEMLNDVQKIVILCDKSLCPNFLIEDHRTIFRSVKDPHQQKTADIEQIRDQIQQIVLSLIEN